MKRTAWLVLTALLLPPLTTLRAADVRRETRDIAGWSVHISQELLTQEAAATERALELLRPIRRNISPRTPRRFSGGMTSFPTRAMS